MPTNNERFEINAAIEKLISRTDNGGEAARIVIKYGSKLKTSCKFQMTYTSNKKSPGQEISGYSADRGEITIKDKARDEQKEWSIGVYKDRIGYYRLWKEAEGRLQFHHFWKSSITTKSIDNDEPERYCLGYDTNSLEPIYFGVRRTRILTSFWIGISVIIRQNYFEQIYGKVPQNSQFGVLLIR